MPTHAPLDELLQHEGASPGPFFGREVALDYGDWPAEYAALKRAAGLVYLAGSTQVEITGADRVGFLNRLCTNQIERLVPGEGCETFLTNAKGHVVAHGLVFARQESLVLRSASGQAPAVLAHLDYYLIHDDVQLHDCSAAWSELLLAGPLAENVLRRQMPVELPARPLAAVETTLGGPAVSIRLIEAAGTPSFLLSADTAAMPSLWRSLREAGAQACGHRALEAFRIEKGWPVYGRDISAANLPQEVGRDRQAISFHKGCYLGQETIARLDSRGHVNKLLVGLQFATPEVPPPQTELCDAGRAVGQVTSAAFSPDLGTAIALGYLRRDRAQPHTSLDSSVGRATVLPLPLG